MPEPAPCDVTGPKADALIPAPADFRALVALFEERGDPRTHSDLYLNVHLVRYEPGRLEIRTRPEAPKALAAQISEALGEWTGRRWVISVSDAAGEPTLREQDRAADDRALAQAAEHPTVRAVLESFPGARIEAVHDLTEPADDDVPPAPIEDE